MDRVSSNELVELLALGYTVCGTTEESILGSCGRGDPSEATKYCLVKKKDGSAYIVYIKK